MVPMRHNTNFLSKMKKIVFLMMIILLPTTMLAQKKQLSQARDILKEGKSPEKAEELMQELLKDSANKENIKIWSTLFSAQTMIYEQDNEKLFLKQEQDTMALFDTAAKLFFTAQVIDTLEAQPDKKGRVIFRFRQHNSAYLNAIRPNLFNGGIYSINNDNPVKAISFLEQYIDCSRQPLFQAYNYMNTDTRIPMAAYWAMYCSRKLGYDDDVLAYSIMAAADTTHQDYIHQYRAEAFEHKGDTCSYVNELRLGFEQFPMHSYFFPRLVEYYELLKRYDDAEKVVDKALSIDSTLILFRFAKSNICLNTQRYDECIILCDSIISEDSLLSDAYYNAGLAYFNKAIGVEKQLMKSKISKAQRRKFIENKETFYRQSLYYLETYRAMEPDKQKQWTVPLYTIYLNLNMGKEFEEIEKLMR